MPAAARPSALGGLELVAVARAWRDDRRPAIVVAVRASRGSVPREAGTRMLVAADDVAGTIGGGHLELMAIERARQMLREGERQPQAMRLPLGPALGQCCGGEVQLALVPLKPKPAAPAPAQTRAHPAVAEADAAVPSAQALRETDLDPALEADPDRWPALPPRFALQLYGAGHVGRAIATLLEGIACRVQWVDEREDQFPATPSPAHIERVCVEPVEAEVAIAPPGALALVLTHSHDLDLRIVEAILRRGDFAFCGLIGSATKRARFASRLRERGLAPEAIARMVCPIGIEGLRGKEPEVIAVSAVAQLLVLSSPAR